MSSNGPPAADSESTLRRSNTVGNTRHQPSHSISSTPAASSAFHGNRAKSGTSRFRSGSLSSGNGGDPGLVRKGSGRAVRKEEVVEESIEEGTTETASWGKGLSRQSSLPSRRGESELLYECIVADHIQHMLVKINFTRSQASTQLPWYRPSRSLHSTRLTRPLDHPGESPSIKVQDRCRKVLSLLIRRRTHSRPWP